MSGQAPSQEKRALVSEIEGLVQQYHSRFIARKVFANMKLHDICLRTPTLFAARLKRSVLPPQLGWRRSEWSGKKSFRWMSMRSRLMMSAGSQFRQWVTVIVRSTDRGLC